MNNKTGPSGILPLIKPPHKTSFHMVAVLRRLTGVQKIGHAGTLDPFASGVMVMLIGKHFTRMADQFLSHDKRYTATLHLGVETDSFDIDGNVVQRSSVIPSLEEVERACHTFQGSYLQTPPMFSAKKIGGKRLYHLARQGIVVERTPVLVHLQLTLLDYTYPYLTIDVRCSKGTYIRALAHDMGKLLQCGAHLSALIRTESGPYHLSQCCDALCLQDPEYPWQEYLCIS